MADEHASNLEKAQPQNLKPWTTPAVVVICDTRKALNHQGTISDGTPAPGGFLAS